MFHKIIVVCFDNGTWLQESIQVAEPIVNEPDFIKDYMDNYEEVKSSIPMMKLTAPSIIHAFLK